VQFFVMSYISKEEYKILKYNELQDLWKNNCPFCRLESQRERVIWKWKFLYIIQAIAPYIQSHKHLMVIPYDHKKYTHELTIEEFWEMRDVELFMKSFYKEEEYFSFIRESMGKRSIEHVHYHFLPWVVRWSKIGEMLELQWYIRN
jgi:diadenosine tetraphosphate (Ap4A) HIT family hydrolase